MNTLDLLFSAVAACVLGAFFFKKRTSTPPNCGIDGEFSYTHGGRSVIKRPFTWWPNTAPSMFERDLLVQLRERTGLEPISHVGTNAAYWTLGPHSAEQIVVIAEGKNGGQQMKERWLLRYSGSDSSGLLELISSFFEPGSAQVRDTEPGQIRAQFKASNFRGF